MPFRLFLLFLLSCGTLRAATLPELLEEVDRIAPLVNKEFFQVLFKDQDIPKAYQQAQDDFFELGRPLLFTEEMSGLIALSPENAKSKDIKRVEAIINQLATLQDKISLLENENDRYLVVSKWRDAYLTQLISYMGLRDTLKTQHAWLGLLTSQLSHDTNINRTPDNAILNLTEEDDSQAMMMFTGIWIPTTHALKSRGWATMTTASLARISYADHKENEVVFLSLEPKFIKSHTGPVASSTWSYRYQHFEFSGNPASRSVNSLFDAHRLGIELGLRPKKFPEGQIAQHQGAMQFSLTEKLYATSSAQDASEIGLGYQHIWTLRNMPINDLTAKVSFADLSTDKTPSSDYSLYTMGAEVSHILENPWHKEPLIFRENLEFGNKKKDSADIVNGDDTTIKFGLSISHETTKRLTAVLNANASVIDYERSGSTDQQGVALGLTWSLK